MYRNENNSNSSHVCSKPVKAVQHKLGRSNVKLSFERSLSFERPSKEEWCCAGASNALQFTLNRPFAKGSQTPQTGQWQWVGLPQANLINGKGFYGDCALVGGLGNVAGVATVEPVCNVTTGTVAAGKLLQGSPALYRLELKGILG